MNYELIDVTTINDKRHIDEVIGYNIYKANAKFFKLKIDIKLFDKHTPFLLVKNKFPYYLNNAIHYVLWINPKYNNLFDDKLINKIVTMRMKDKNHIYFENIENNKSIKTIKHYHIFIKDS